MKGLWLLGALTCSRREDGLSCRHGVKPPLTRITKIAKELNRVLSPWNSPLMQGFLVRPEDGLRCRQGVKPPFKLKWVTELSTLCCRKELSTDQVDKPVNTAALTKWVGHIPSDVRQDMAQLAPMLSRLGYDPNGYPPDYGTPDKLVQKHTADLDLTMKLQRAKEQRWNWLPFL